MISNNSITIINTTSNNSSTVTNNTTRATTMTTISSSNITTKITTSNMIIIINMIKIIMIINKLRYMIKTKGTQKKNIANGNKNQGNNNRSMITIIMITIIITIIMIITTTTINITISSMIILPKKTRTLVNKTSSWINLSFLAFIRDMKIIHSHLKRISRICWRWSITMNNMDMDSSSNRIIMGNRLSTIVDIMILNKTNIITNLTKILIMISNSSSSNKYLKKMKNLIFSILVEIQIKTEKASRIMQSKMIQDKLLINQSLIKMTLKQVIHKNMIWLVSSLILEVQQDQLSNQMQGV